MKSKKLRVAVAVAAAAVCAALLAPSALAGGFTWTGEGDGQNWSNECNWWPKNQCKQEYPHAPQDDAVVAYIPGKTPPRVVLGESLSLGSLSVDGPVSLSGGSIAVSKSFNWSGGTLATQVTIGGLASGNIDGKIDHTLGADIINSGRLTLGPAKVSVGSKVGIVNRASGTVTAALGAYWQGLICCVDPPRINNLGTFNVSAPLIAIGAKEVKLSSVAFYGAGKVNVGKGTLLLEKAPSQIAPGTRIDGGGKITVGNGAILKFSGPFNVAKGTDLELLTNGVLTGNGLMTGGGTLLWKGGRIDSTLTLSGVEAVLDGPDSKDLGGAIVNKAHVNVLFPSSKKGTIGPLRLGSKAKFVNEGSFVARTGFAMQGLVCCASPAEFVNTGYLGLSQNPNGKAGEPVTIANIRFKADGEVHLEKTRLEFPVGLLTLAEGGTLTGQGTAVISEATDATLAGYFKAEPKTVVELRGDLAGEGHFGGGAPLRWVAGRITGKVTVTSQSLLEVSTPAWKELSGHLTTLGRGTFSSTKPAQLRITGGAEFTSAGPFTASGKVEFFGPICCVNPGRFVNEHTFTVAGGADVAANLIRFENRGSLVLKGLFRVPGGYFVQKEGETEFAGGRMTSREIVDVRGGSVVGSGTIEGPVRNGGTFAPGGEATGVLKVVGSYRQVPGGTLAVDLKGSRPGSGHDQLQVTGDAWLAGRLKIKSAFSPAPNARLEVVRATDRYAEFSQAGNLELPNGHRLEVDYGAGDVSLIARRIGG